ncbi:MAG: hypothetical protein PUP91_07405 [Rhizonema sp. PD37]|nr:hypothetical protein [Rhizonema sp. PD37]
MIISKQAIHGDEFLDHFPSVSREQAIATLELTKEMLAKDANSFT